MAKRTLGRLILIGLTLFQAIIAESLACAQSGAAVPPVLVSQITTALKADDAWQMPQESLGLYYSLAMSRDQQVAELREKAEPWGTANVMIFNFCVNYFVKDGGIWKLLSSVNGVALTGANAQYDCFSKSDSQFVISNSVTAKQTRDFAAMDASKQTANTVSVQTLDVPRRPGLATRVASSCSRQLTKWLTWSSRYVASPSTTPQAVQSEVQILVAQLRCSVVGRI